MWCEGPAWCAQGRYLVWSDSRTTASSAGSKTTVVSRSSRLPSNNSNGNAFDSQGRQLTCEHLTRRVVRYEHDGSVTVIADSYGGKHLNSPNDVVAHPDGSVWFTDPPFGEQMYEGAPDAAGGPAIKRDTSDRASASRPTSARSSASCRQCVPCRPPREAGPRGQGGAVAGAKRAGLLARLQEALRRGRKQRCRLRRGADATLTNQKMFASFTVDGIRCGTDGIRVDVDGNLWCASNAGRTSATVVSPCGRPRAS